MMTAEPFRICNCSVNFKFGFIGLLNLVVGEGLAPPEIRKNIR